MQPGVMITFQVQVEFISFGGVKTLLSYVCPSPKLQVLCGTTLDIFILLSSDCGNFAVLCRVVTGEHSRSFQGSHIFSMMSGLVLWPISSEIIFQLHSLKSSVFCFKDSRSPSRLPLLFLMIIIIISVIIIIIQEKQNIV